MIILSIAWFGCICMFTGLVFISMNRGVLSWLIFTCYMSLMHLGVSPHQLFTLPNSIPVAFQSRPSLCPLSCWLILNRVVATMCRYYSNYLPKKCTLQHDNSPSRVANNTRNILKISPQKDFIPNMFDGCLAYKWCWHSYEPISCPQLSFIFIYP